MLHGAIFLATCNAILLLRDVKLPITSLHYTGEGYFRYGRAPSPQAFTGVTAKFNMAPILGPRASRLTLRCRRPWRKPKREVI